MMLKDSQLPVSRFVRMLEVAVGSSQQTTAGPRFLHMVMLETLWARNGGRGLLSIPHFSEEKFNNSVLLLLVYY